MDELAGGAVGRRIHRRSASTTGCIGRREMLRSVAVAPALADLAWYELDDPLSESA